MLLRMTLCIPEGRLRNGAPMRFNEAGAMLLRMTALKESKMAISQAASMRPEQCCSG